MIRPGHVPQRTVVVDFGEGSIQIALAESACEAVRFHGITMITVPRGTGDREGEERLAIELLRAEIGRRGWQGMRAACLLSGSATSTQSFLFPPMPAADLRRAIELKLEETLHFDVSEASFDHRREAAPASEEGGPALTLVAAAQDDAIERGVAALRAAGLRPVAVGAAAESLANLSQCTSLWDSEEASIHVYVGAHSTILNLFEGNRLRFSREIDTAGEAFTAALMRPILTEHGPVQLSYLEAEEVKAAAGIPRDDEDRTLPFSVRSHEILPLVEPVAQRLSAEIERSIGYLCSLLARPRVDGVVLSGPAGRMRHLDRYLQEALDVPVIYSDPVERAMAHWRLAVTDECPSDLSSFSAILGYSLGHREPINLLPREVRFEEVLDGVTGIRKATVPVVGAAGLCLALAGVPIARSYGSAGEVLQWSATQLDARLERQELVLQQQREARDALASLRAERGPSPDWTGVIQELSSVLPEDSWVTRLESRSSREAPSLHVWASVATSSTPFHAETTALATGLASSPFFKGVEVVDAVASDDEAAGTIEATLSIVAPHEAPTEDAR